jgi:hypothetical protein
MLLLACFDWSVVGKLGHNDMNRVYKPKVIEALAGLTLRKVTCSGQCSMALTSEGQVSEFSHMKSFPQRSLKNILA